jgi:aryl-phospho-beta-D-glucosidase BglC (GH1 family)
MKNVIYSLFSVFSLLCIFPSFSLAQTTPLAANGRLKVTNRQLCNEAGTPIQLRGMSTHGLQWFGSCYTSGATQALANSWGCDVFRAAMYVDEGGYLSNKAGIKAQVDNITDWSAQYGMYCIIDWHILNPGDPNIHTADAIDFFRQEAQRNAGKKHVIYEICNEPNGVSWASIKSYAEQVIPVIRQYDPEAIILVGTPNWSGTPGDVTSNPLTGANAYNVMYTFHFYAGSHYTQSYIDGVLQNIPLFISEWGTSNYSGNGGNDYTNAQNWINLLAGANTAGIKVSWCNWSFCDKSETSAALNAGACGNSGWNNTSESGTWVKNHILSPADSWGGGTTNLPPSVSITSPTNNASFNAPATIAIAANATDADGTVSKVDFYNGTTLLGSDNTAPYTFSWANVAAGNYVLTAKATDNSGAVTTSSTVNIVVNTATTNQPPSVSITSPTNNASFNAPATIAIAANATDADGTITKVDFYNGTTLLGSDNTAPYTFSWAGVAVGNYALTAKATDNSGAVTTSSTVNIVVKTATTNQPPSVSITSPTNNASFNAPATIAIAANATDADGTITKVDFYNGTTLLGSDNTAPYTFSWANVTVGNYALTAKATDNSGAVTTSSTVNIVVKTTTTNQPPSVSITSPTNNASFNAPATIAIAANATDADGTITKVDFYNGTTLLGSDNTAPYTFSWASVVVGNYALTAKATDNSGAVTTSATVNIVVVSTTTTADIIGPDCVAVNGIATFELSAANRTNATAYSWWCNGSTSSITPVAGQPWKATINFGPYFTGGSVCAGVNYSASPWYKQICKTVSLCPSARLQVMNTKSSLVSPVPSNSTFNLIVNQNVQGAKVFDQLGVEKLNLEAIPNGQTRSFGEYLPTGIYFMTIRYEDNTSEIIKLVKSK